MTDEEHGDVGRHVRRAARSRRGAVVLLTVVVALLSGGAAMVSGVWDPTQSRHRLAAETVAGDPGAGDTRGMATDGAAGERGPSGAPTEPTGPSAPPSTASTGPSSSALPAAGPPPPGSSTGPGSARANASATTAPAATAPAAAAPPAAAPTGGRPAPGADAATTMADAVVAAMAGQRASQGLAPFATSTCLRDQAASRVATLVATGAFAHLPLDPVLAACGGSSVAENLALGQGSGAAVVDAWMASPGHRANVLGPFTQVGVACGVQAGRWLCAAVFRG